MLYGWPSACCMGGLVQVVAASKVEQIAGDTSVYSACSAPEELSCLCHP